MPGDHVTQYHSHGVRSAPLAHGHGENHIYSLLFEPGGVIGSHTAGFDQLFYVIEGTAWVIVGDQRIELAAHEAAVIDLGEIHSKGSDGGARVLMVQVDSLDSPRGD